MLKIFDEYKGLRKEAYLLLIGRMVSTMGSLVFSLLALILKNKLGYSSSAVANVLLLTTFIYIPGTMIAGKLCDHFNKRNLILIFSAISSVCYIICGVLPMTEVNIAFYIAASLFSMMQWPCYDTLYADLSKTADRDKVYSLNYLSANLGAVMAPIIGGFLFENQLNISFFVTAGSAIISSLIIFWKVRDIHKEVDENSHLDEYQQEVSGQNSILQIFKERKLLFFYFFCFVTASMVYSQFMFLLPLNLEQLYQDKGAAFFGNLLSFNSAIVVFGTPLLTALFRKKADTEKMVFGKTLISLALFSFIFIQGKFPLYFVAIFVFTIGEILSTLGEKPYLSKRIPVSFRGRIISLAMISAQIGEGLFHKVMGVLLDHYSAIFCWWIIAGIGLVIIIAHTILNIWDKKLYPALRENQSL